MGIALVIIGLVLFELSMLGFLLFMAYESYKDNMKGFTVLFLSLFSIFLLLTGGLFLEIGWPYINERFG